MAGKKQARLFAHNKILYGNEIGHIYEPHESPWRAELFHTIFGVDTPRGKSFDIILIWMIFFSVVIVMLDSVRTIHNRHAELLMSLEWFFTIVFSVEYLLRIISVKKPFRYIFSVYGLVDLLSIIPTYLSLFTTGMGALLIIRTWRLLRIFRIFKLTHYIVEMEMLTIALQGSRRKIFVFMLTVLSIATIMGAIMYLVEGEESGFTSIPEGMYWAIVTMTTVGYGDIAPVTVLGQTLAGFLMILGYGILAVPTGIFSTELVLAAQKKGNVSEGKICSFCNTPGHDQDAVFCKYCGHKVVD